MDISVNKCYKHYKGGLYKVLYLAKHTETEEIMVVYKSLYGNNDIWCRPLSMWNDLIEIDGKIVKRFQLVKEI